MYSIVFRPLFRGLTLGVCLSLAAASAFAASIPIHSAFESSDCEPESATPWCPLGLAFDSGSLQLIRSISGGVETDDIRGLANFSVIDPGLVGSFSFADPTLGTDPGFAVLPFGNAEIVALNAGPTQLALFFTLVDPLVAIGAPTSTQEYMVGFVPSPLTDSALRAVTSTGKLHLGFNYVGDFSAAPADQYLVYSLASASIVVPEPSTNLLCGLGLIILSLFGSFVRRNGIRLRRVQVGE